MIAKFLNASTADGYNPYRMTRDGIEWEVPEPRRSLGQHRLLGRPPDHLPAEAARSRRRSSIPARCAALLDQRDLRLRRRALPHRPTPILLRDPRNTIDFDRGHAGARSRRACTAMGTDGKLVTDADGAGPPRHPGREAAGPAAGQALQPRPGRRHLDEHPAPGVERRQQRPGRQGPVGGHRWPTCAATCVSCASSLPRTAHVAVSAEVASCSAPSRASSRSIGPTDRRRFDAGARRASWMRWAALAALPRGVYRDGLSGTATVVAGDRSVALLRRWRSTTSTRILREPARRRPLPRLQHPRPVRRRRRSTHCYEMLEGQVAVLSRARSVRRKRFGSAAHACAQPALPRRPAQLPALPRHGRCPRFLEQNSVPGRAVGASPLVAALLAAGDRTIVVRDATASCTSTPTSATPGIWPPRSTARTPDPGLARLVEADRRPVLDLFEDIFHHLLHRPLRHLLRLRGPGQRLLAHGFQAAAGRPGDHRAGARPRGAEPAVLHAARGRYYASAPASASISPRSLRRLPHRPLLAHPASRAPSSRA